MVSPLPAGIVLENLNSAAAAGAGARALATNDAISALATPEVTERARRHL